MIKKLKLAILDMNNGHPNLGLGCITEIVSTFDEEIDWEVFDARVKNEIPDTSFDIYISSGGPGSPMERGEWRDNFEHLVDTLWKHNKTSEEKKFFFFICHSFQLICQHFQLGEIKERRSTSFGVHPVHKTAAGKRDELLAPLDNPYTVVDSRDWQLIQPNLRVFRKWGASILSLEKIRTHVELERAIMAVRFSDEFVGTQYHPEAEPISMKEHFSKPGSKEKVVKNFGEKKYRKMMTNLENVSKLQKTYENILPSFIRKSIDSKRKEPLAVSS